jgi:hypothetical protein
MVIMFEYGMDETIQNRRPNQGGDAIIISNVHGQLVGIYLAMDLTVHHEVISLLSIDYLVIYGKEEA